MRKKKAELTTEVAAVQGSDDMEGFIERMIEAADDIPLRECFARAVDTAAFMTVLRNKTVLQGSRYLPKAVDVLGIKALQGDLKAIDMLFDYLGVKVRAPLVAQQTVVNVAIPTLKDIIDV